MEAMRTNWECRIFFSKKKKKKSNCWLVPLWTKRNLKEKNSMENFIIMTNRIRPILFEITSRFAVKSNVNKKTKHIKNEKKKRCIKLVLIANECFPRRTFWRTIHKFHFVYWVLMSLLFIDILVTIKEDQQISLLFVYLCFFFYCKEKDFLSFIFVEIDFLLMRFNIKKNYI